MVTWLITVVGKDQPELLYKFCETIALMEGVFLDKQQTVMAGRVTAMFKVCLPAAHVPFSRKIFAEYTVKGLEVISVQDLSSEKSKGCHLVLEVQGQYRFGIDYDIRTILESHGAQIGQFSIIWGRPQKVSRSLPLKFMLNCPAPYPNLTCYRR